MAGTETSSLPFQFQGRSFEYKCAFAYNIAMVILSMIGTVPVADDIAIAVLLLCAFAILSILHRMRVGWHLPALEVGDVAKAGVVVIATAVFAYISATDFKPGDTGIVPWMLLVAGIGLTGILYQLKLMTVTEVEFRAPAANDAAATSNDDTDDAYADPDEPASHHTIRRIYMAAFIVVWLVAMSFFLVNAVTLREGSPHPTATQTVPMHNHGPTVYASAGRAAFVRDLQIAMFAGIPALMAAGLILQFLGGIRIFTGGVWILGRRVS